MVVCVCGGGGEQLTNQELQGKVRGRCEVEDEGGEGLESSSCAQLLCSLSVE